MKNATGPPFPIEGTTSFTISNSNKTRTTEVVALVVKNLNHPILLSWLSCVQLDLIHSSFPLVPVSDYCKNQIFCTQSINLVDNAPSHFDIDVKKLLINEYPDVIHDYLLPRACSMHACG